MVTLEAPPELTETPPTRGEQSFAPNRCHRCFATYDEPAALVGSRALCARCRLWLMASRQGAFLLEIALPLLVWSRALGVMSRGGGLAVGLGAGLIVLYVLLRDARAGQSVAKRWFRIQVVQQDGRTPGRWRQSVQRNALFVAVLPLGPLGLVLILAEMVTMMIRHDMRRLGDLWAGTVVVPVGKGAT